MRVLAAMSGGVDSAVAAARAVDAGHEVVGVHMALNRSPGTLRTGSRGCCTIEDALDARRAADLLGIPFYVWDLSEDFVEDVVADFVAEYAAGRTPNPCVRCNERIKFAALLDKGIALGFDAVATGHYARVVTGPDGRAELHRAADAAKDQSYVLAVLDADQVAHAMFPLGDAPTKAEVRAEAERRGLPVASKPDSHDICFIPDGDTRGFLADKLGEVPGEVVDESGEVLGTHTGTYGYTVGQRKGLGISRPAADGRPRYVLSIEPVRRTVTVGPAERLSVGALEAVEAVWNADAPVGPVEVHVQVRAHGEPVPAVAELTGPADDPVLRVRLRTPLSGVAPGQTVAVYRGTRVLGSATISGTTPLS
ncbi:tRNA-specific 2-thiouridylase [Kineococcus radiotolerans]|uniref:tRNA-specific 2-thiouridylase MnmA n=2 Tax=Kineococcus radiotolerans TaxID=131568 RepID=MNMA_KINRD|nr:tRNA 2-thiouridine(34) synthase MnmA [Kineococcus radiotolerans]A6W7K7.2 RecName: Full=tRNA-specific 2-thiouridylase MnmA [Kineococcus radiotolerans SRS30216 = ATCC BAA-149]MBB2900010.1 tRNA-specific 2-thiouridylase [Kineococcus radiotolerans]